MSESWVSASVPAQRARYAPAEHRLGRHPMRKILQRGGPLPACHVLFLQMTPAL